MSDLRALLYEPLMETDASHNQFERRAALATRMPEAVPAGLEDAGKKGWWLWTCQKERGEGMRIEDDTADLLFIGNAVEVLVKELDGGVDAWIDANGKFWVYGMEGSPTLIIALTTALHRLCDERDTAKETT